MKEKEFLRTCNFDESHCASTYCKEASYFKIYGTGVTLLQ